MNQLCWNSKWIEMGSIYQTKAFEYNNNKKPTTDNLHFAIWNNCLSQHLSIISRVKKKWPMQKNDKCLNERVKWDWIAWEKVTIVIIIIKVKKKKNIKSHHSNALLSLFSGTLNDQPHKIRTSRRSWTHFK